MDFQPNQFPRNEQGQDYLDPAIEQAFLFADATLEKNTINMHDFTELYGGENVARDMLRVDKKEQRLTADTQAIHAEVLEAILYEQIGNGKWFGEHATAIKTSKYDDYFNGSDLILEIEESARTLSHLSLSVDVTFGTTTEEKKFAWIKENIDDESLGRIKYFHSERGGFRGELSKVPQVVIGVDKELLIKLAGLWADKGGLKKEHRDTLANHPVQRVIFAEILLQLQTFKIYAETTGKKSLIPVYQKSINVLEEILRSKEPASLGDLRNDKVFTAIREALKIFRETK